MVRSARPELEKDNPIAPQIYQSPRKRAKPVEAVVQKRVRKKPAGKKKK
jgi:hypothetical protein